MSETPNSIVRRRRRIPRIFNSIRRRLTRNDNHVRFNVSNNGLRIDRTRTTRRSLWPVHRRSQRPQAFVVDDVISINPSSSPGFDINESVFSNNASPMTLGFTTLQRTRPSRDSLLRYLKVYY